MKPRSNVEATLSPVFILLLPARIFPSPTHSLGIPIHFNLRWCCKQKKKDTHIYKYKGCSIINNKYIVTRFQHMFWFMLDI